MKRIIDPVTGDIDWADFRGRVAKAFDASDRPGADRAQAILDARARRLAQTAEAAVAPAETLEILPFRLGREQYGLETRFAREVVRLTGFTVIPSVPDFVIGVANLRGEITPIFDLMLFFGFASQGLTDRSRVIVIGQAEAEFCVIADTVQDVSRLAVDDLVPNSAFEGKRGRECVRGVTRDAMILLDGAALLADQRLFVGASGNAVSHA